VFTGIIGTTITAPTIKASSTLLYGNNINVATKISSIETSSNGKQNVLTYDDDLVINSIVVKPGFTKVNYTEAVDGEIRCDILTVADVNISTLIASKQNT